MVYKVLIIINEKSFAPAPAHSSRISGAGAQIAPDERGDVTTN